MRRRLRRHEILGSGTSKPNDVVRWIVARLELGKDLNGSTYILSDAVDDGSAPENGQVIEKVERRRATVSGERKV